MAKLLEVDDHAHENATSTVDALNDSEERLQLALDAARMTSFDFDIMRARITWSRGHEALWGFQPGAFAGAYESLFERVHPEDLPGVKAEVVRCIEAREPFAHEFRIVWPDGSVHWLAANGRFIFDEHGRLVRSRGIAWETTTRKHSDEALRKKEHFLSESLSAAHIGGWSSDLTGRINWTDETYSIYGVSPKMFTPTVESLVNLVHPEDRPAMRRWMEACAAGEKPGALEFRCLRPDGSARYLSCSGELKRSTGDAPAQIEGTVQDITKRTRTEKALRESSKRLREMSRQLINAEEKERQLLARELHDRVGQNLAVLGINLTRLRGDKTITAETQARIDDSLAVLEATGIVISNVLTDLKPPMLSSHGVLEAFRWQAKQLAQRTGLAVEVTGSAALRLTSEIEFALFRIVQSALNNIAQHARAHNVAVRFDMDGNMMRLEVADDGSGFDTGASSVAGRFGLAIMKERAEAINGSLRIASAPGRGTRVIVEVPTNS